MNRTGDPSVEELIAYIAALQAENRQLAERLVKLEEELALARLHRFAPKSAVVYSLMLTCRASRVELLAWLRHVLTELPQRAADADITDLLPFNFAKTAAVV